jgi:putative membrane protein
MAGRTRAVNHWVRCERAMRRGEDLPVSRFPALLGVVVALVAVAMVFVVLVGWDT